MAYYTVAHLLQGAGNFDGTQPGPAGITADQLTDAVWDYIFKQGAYPDGCSISETVLQRMRREFEYWYPLDLRVSGKDLVRNHLTMSLYNHAAIWPDRPEMWPRSFFTNGHVGVDGAKMAKSLGNFITAYGALATNNVHYNQKDGEWKSQSWCADTVRLALALAGDTMGDANFKSDIADKEILALQNELTWIQEQVEMSSRGELRTGDLNIQDQVFHLAMDDCIQEADTMYASMKYSLAVKAVYYDLKEARNTYRGYFELANGVMHADLVRRYTDVFITMLSPVCTHLCDYIWRDVLGRPGSVTKAPWPATSGQAQSILKVSNFLQKTLERFLKDLFGKKKKKKGKKKGKTAEGQDVATAEAPKTRGVIFVQRDLPVWKQVILKWLDSQWDDGVEGGFNKKVIMGQAKRALQEDTAVQEAGKFAMKYLAQVVGECRQRGRGALALSPAFDEAQVLQSQATYFAGKLRLEEITVEVLGADCSTAIPVEQRVLERAEPGKPSLWLH